MTAAMPAAGHPCHCEGCDAAKCGLARPATVPGRPSMWVTCGRVARLGGGGGGKCDACRGEVRLCQCVGTREEGGLAGRVRCRGGCGGKCAYERSEWWPKGRLCVWCKATRDDVGW